ncbi:MAG: [FeFe] hydrogenase H-cluster maturation GTPase HydF [Firmicutes bacterium]|nr:[FeFe] hydrogenase H-cluster maturation GTPase HydF [Bacillota bacterium]
MSLQSTPTSGRLHIAFFGRRNAGKSSLLNALTGQSAALVSDVPGTTTDPVWKSMEILPLGPCVVIDTAGIDDVGELGRLRVERTQRVLGRTDLAVLVVDAGADPASGKSADRAAGNATGGGGGTEEELLLEELARRGVPVVVAVNKADVADPARHLAWAEARGLPAVAVSALTGRGLGALRQALVAAAPADWEGPPIIGDLVEPGDLVVLVVPVDLEAPKGRLILPQVQTLRDLLDHEAMGLVVKETGLEAALRRLEPRRPRLVVTDSQAFHSVSRVVPREVPLTSFSILFARHRGDLATLVAGARAADNLRPGDRVLVAEACTHHPIGDDIGRVKIPRWLEKHVGGPLDWTHSVGGDFPADLAGCRLVIHCGACMVNRREMLRRLAVAAEAGVPVVNYGVLIAHLHGILPRALEPFRVAEAARRGA